jgi:tRNA (guanosine-2'-O-)-methyltransferase
MRRQTPDLRRADELLGPDAAGPASVEPSTMVVLCESMVTDERKARLEEVIARRLQSVVVVLDGPHDPHNGAAVIRTCDAFSIQNLHVIERYEPFLVAPCVAKGSEQWVDVHTHDSTDALLGVLAAAQSASDRAAEPGKPAPFELVATAADGELLPNDLRDIPRLALVVGNEREGIAPDLRLHCRRAVRVPMTGFIDSLNLSVSTAILLYAATLGRAGDLPSEERLRIYARGLYLTVARAAEVLLAARRQP